VFLLVFRGILAQSFLSDFGQFLELLFVLAHVFFLLFELLFHLGDGLL
jgi:hypothetical protein